MTRARGNETSFAKRHRAAVIAGTIVVAALAVLVSLLVSGTSGPTNKVALLQVIQVVQPPPPPPPPPDEPPPPPEQAMLKQPEIPQPELKDEPKEAPDKAADQPLGLDQAGTGPGDGFNLAGRPGGSGLLGGGAGGGGSRFGWYAAKVQTSIEAALRNNHKTRKASIAGLRVRLWLGPTGSVTRVQLVSSTGNTDVDHAIESEVLRSVQFEPPPPDMPLPIVMRIQARRPS